MTLYPRIQIPQRSSREQSLRDCPSVAFKGTDSRWDRWALSAARSERSSPKSPKQATSCGNLQLVNTPLRCHRPRSRAVAQQALPLTTLNPVCQTQVLALIPIPIFLAPNPILLASIPMLGSSARVRERRISLHCSSQAGHGIDEGDPKSSVRAPPSAAPISHRAATEPTANRKRRSCLADEPLCHPIRRTAQLVGEPGSGASEQPVVVLCEIRPCNDFGRFVGSVEYEWCLLIVL